MSNELTEAENTAEKIVANITETMERGERLATVLAFPTSKDEDALKAAAQVYADADLCLNELHRAWTHGEEQRVEFTKPLNDVLKKINVTFKARLDPVVTLKDMLRRRMSDYARAELTWKRSEEDRKRREEMKRREDEQVARAAEAERMGMNKVAETILDRPIAQPKVEVTGATDQAKSTSTVKWTAVVSDKMAFIKAVAEGKIDPEYLKVEEAALRRLAATLKDKMKWPGVDVFEDVQIGSRR